MKRKSPTLVGARKRARVSDGSSSPSPESPSRCVAAVKETLSIREQAEPYRLATVKFPIDDLTPEWTDGTNRTINAAHKRRLTRAFGQFGLDRMAEGNRLRLASTKEEVSRMMEELRRAGEVGANEGRRSDRERPWASFWDWVRINGTQVELMAGNHRVEALKDYLKQFPDAAHERWWLCDIYDRDTLPLELSVQLRANRDDLALPDSHAQIWTELVTLSAHDPGGLFRGPTRQMEEQMTQQLGLNGRASFPVRRLGTLWRNPGWRDVITAWCRFPLGQATFNMSTFEWMSSCRIDEFWFAPLREAMDTLTLLREQCGIEVSPSDWGKLVRLPRSRTAQDVEKLFFPGWVKGIEADVSRLRVRDFFSTLDDADYDDVYGLVVTDSRLTFPNIDELLKVKKEHGKVMSAVMAHVGQWLNREPYRVADRSSNKPPLRQDLLPALEQRYGADADQQSRELQMQVLTFVRQRMHEFTHPTMEPYLNAYPHGHVDTYVERFEHECWRDLLVLVHGISGPHFQDRAMLRFNHDEPSQLGSRPASTITQTMCHLLERIPEISRNPALQGKEAINTLCASIHPLVMAWAAQHCEKALSVASEPWTEETTRLVKNDLARYQALAAVEVPDGKPPAKGKEKARVQRHEKAVGDRLDARELSASSPSVNEPPASHQPLGPSSHHRPGGMTPRSTPTVAPLPATASRSHLGVSQEKTRRKPGAGGRIAPRSSQVGRNLKMSQGGRTWRPGRAIQLVPLD